MKHSEIMMPICSDYSLHTIQRKGMYGPYSIQNYVNFPSSVLCTGISSLSVRYIWNKQIIQLIKHFFLT